MVRGGKKECCTRERNLVRIYPDPNPQIADGTISVDIRNDLFIDQCSVCGCKHYTALLDPGKAISKGSAVG
jgi:hypothetical protein